MRSAVRGDRAAAQGCTASSGTRNAFANFFSVAAVPARMPPSIWLTQGLLTPAASARAREGLRYLSPNGRWQVGSCRFSSHA